VSDVRERPGGDVTAVDGSARLPADIAEQIEAADAWRTEQDAKRQRTPGRITGCERQGGHIALRVEVEDEGEYVGLVAEDKLMGLPADEQRARLVEAVRQERERRRRRVDVTAFTGDVAL